MARAHATTRVSGGTSAAASSSISSAAGSTAAPTNPAVAGGAPTTTGGATTRARVHTAPITARTASLAYKGPTYERTATGEVIPFTPPPPTGQTDGATGGSPVGLVGARPKLLVPGVTARFVDGLAAAPMEAPAAVQEIVWAGNQLIGLPYIYGGGHASFSSPGYDCSGTVSFALHGGNLLSAPMDSSEFMAWGEHGVGQWVTVFSNPGHAYMTVAGLRLDTSPADDPTDREGPRWRPLRPANPGFVRSPPARAVAVRQLRLSLPAQSAHETHLRRNAMAGLTGRMSTVVKAKVSKLLDQAEDPAETLDYSYQKQVEQLQNVKKGIADVVTAKKRLQMQESTLQQQIVKLDTQARQALAGGQEDLARQALERKNVVQTELQSLDTQVTELEDQQQKLVDSEQKLRAKIEAFRTKKEVIKAQYSAAEAQVRISEAATGVGEQMADVGLAMQRAVDKTENMKARADAVTELEAAGTFDDITALGSGEDDIDRQLKQLSSTSAVDDELAKLKAELGAGPAAAA